MVKKNASVSRKSVTAIIATTAIAMMLLSLVPAMALPGDAMATIMGTVTDYNNGEPIEGAKVTISYHNIVRTDVTDSAGMYKFTNVPECYCLKELTASKEQYRPETKQVGVSGVTVVDFELWIEEQEPNQGTVMGTVTDNNTGEPIEGALVELLYHDIVRSTLTAASGKYVFDEVPECFCLKTIKVTKEHYRPESEDVPVSGVTIVDFRLWIEEQEPQQGTVTGTVTDYNNGEPIEGALVVLRYHETIMETYTDADGKYRFEEVPECRCYKSVEVTMKGYVPESKDVAVSGPTVVDFQLWIEEQEPPMGTVTGTVTDYHTGKYIMGAQVVIEYDDHHRFEYTDENGQYTFEDVPEDLGPATITVSMDGYMPEKTATAIEGVTVVDFQLWIEEQEPPEHEGVITGTVFDAHDGTPIAGVLMTLEHDGEVRTTLTNARGGYTFYDVPMCFCLKKVSASKDGYLLQSKEVAVDGTTVVDFELMAKETKPVPPGGDRPDPSPVITDGSEASEISMGPAIIAVSGLLAIISALVMFALVLSSRRGARAKDGK